MVLPKKYLSFFIFSAILLIAIFFRFWKLDVIPFGLNNDAAWEGSAAREILRGNYSPYLPYAAEGWRGEGIIRLVVAFLMTIFGNVPMTIRLASGIFGLGLIIAIFFLIKNLFNQKLAFLTSFLISISGWHITFSKSGWRAITVPFFTTLLFYFLFKGIKKKKNKDFILTGSMLSITSFYTYDAARIVPIFFIFWLLIEILSRKDFIENYGRQLLYLFLTAFIVALPMIFYAINNWTNFTSRSEFLFVGHQIEKAGNFSPLTNNVVASVLLFNVRANGNDFFTSDPLVDKPVSWFLPIGLAITLYYAYKKNKRYFFMLTWFIASLIPGILSIPNGNRVIGSIPTVYFFAAVGLFYALKITSRVIFKKKSKIIAYYITILVCIYTIALTYKDYLGPNRKELTGFYPETLVVANYIKTIWDKYDIYLTDNYPRELLTYYLYKDQSKNAFINNYTWYENGFAFLNINSDKVASFAQSLRNSSKHVLGASTKSKGTAFFMFDNSMNERIAEELLSIHPKAKKIYLISSNINIKNPASLAVLCPSN